MLLVARGPVYDQVPWLIEASPLFSICTCENYIPDLKVLAKESQQSHLIVAGQKAESYPVSKTAWSC